MRRLLLALVLAAGLAAIAYALLGGGDARRPRPIPEQEDVPEAVAPSVPTTPIPPAAATAPVVIRVRMTDGGSLPAGTQAGYRRMGTQRLRPAAADGTFRFSDAPVGALELVAEAPGCRADPVAIEVVPNQTNEGVVVLEGPAPTTTPPK